MALILQNDLGDVAGANSIVDVATYVAYWATRSVAIDISTPELETAVEADLIEANSYQDNLNEYCGYKLTGYTQTTEFPRSELYYYGQTTELIEGIPQGAKDGVCEYGYIHSQQGTLQPNEAITGAIKSEEKGIGSLKKKIEYCGCGSSGGVISYPIADNKIPKDFICSSDGMGVHV